MHIMRIQGEDPNYTSVPNSPQIGERECEICQQNTGADLALVSHRVNGVYQNERHCFHRTCLRQRIEQELEDSCANPDCGLPMDRVYFVDGVNEVESHELSVELSLIASARVIDHVELDELNLNILEDHEEDEGIPQQNASFEKFTQCCFVVYFIAAFAFGMWAVSQFPSDSNSNWNPAIP